MLSRWLTCLMLVASVAFAAPWRVVCSPGCWQECGAAGAGCSAWGTGPSCCGSTAPRAQPTLNLTPSCAAADSCCDAEPLAAERCGEDLEAVGTCACARDSEGEGCGQCGYCCCAFVPLSPCRGCDFARVTLWAPSKDHRETGPADGVESSVAVATIALPRPAPMLRCGALNWPPWRPSGTGLLNRICVLTI